MKQDKTDGFQNHKKRLETNLGSQLLKGMNGKGECG